VQRPIIPRIIIPDAEDEEVFETSNIAPSPTFLAVSPSVSRRVSFEDTTNKDPTNSSEEEIDHDPYNQASSSHLAPDSDPVRIVYSPTVSRSRSGSLSHSPARPSIVLTADDEQQTNAIPQLTLDTSNISPSRLRASSFESPTSARGHIRRRSRANSNVSTTPTINEDEQEPPKNQDTSTSASLQRPNGTSGSPSPSYQASDNVPSISLDSSAPSSASQALQASLNLDAHSTPSRPRRGTLLELGIADPDISPVNYFHAFPEQWSWWRSMWVAKIALAIVSACVVGNLVYV